MTKCLKRLCWFLFCLNIYFQICSTTYDYGPFEQFYDLDELPNELYNIIQTRPEYIHLFSSWEHNQDKIGTYKLFPYYQKISPELEPNNLQSSRFIIHKHVISGQWQLSEFHSYPYTRAIKTSSLEITSEDENPNIQLRNYLIQNNMHGMQTLVSKLEQELILKSDHNAILLSLLQSNDPKYSGNLLEREQMYRNQNERVIPNEESLSTRKMIFDIESTIATHQNTFQEETKTDDLDIIPKEMEFKLNDKNIEISDLKFTIENSVMHQKELETTTSKIESLIETNYNTSEERPTSDHSDTMQKEMEFKLGEKDHEISNLKFQIEKLMNEKELEEEATILKLGKREKDFKLKIQNQQNKIDNFKKQLAKSQNLQKQHGKTFQEKIRLMKNENDLKLSTLKKENFQKIENLKENHEHENVEQKMEIKKLQDQLLECQNSNSYLKNEISGYAYKQDCFQSTIRDLQAKQRHFEKAAAKEELEKKLDLFESKEKSKTSKIQEQAKNEKEISKPNNKHQENGKIIFQNKILEKMGITECTLNKSKECKTMSTMIAKNKQNQTELSHLTENWKKRFQDLIFAIKHDYDEHRLFLSNQLHAYNSLKTTSSNEKNRLSKIILDTEPTIFKRPEFRYESVIVAYAGLLYHGQQRGEFIKYFPFLQEEIKVLDTGRDIWKIRFFEVQALLLEIFQQQKEITENAFQLLNNTKEINFYKSLIKNEHILLDNKYKYEFLLVQYGLVLYAQTQFQEVTKLQNSINEKF